MPAFFIEPENVEGDAVVFEGEEAHHIRVRRHGVGDEIDAIDGCGRGLRLRIDAVARGRVTARILRRVAELGESTARLHLAAAVVKGSRFDLVVEKATEVGVASITPVLASRGVVRPTGGGRVDRWRRLARSAAKQCGRSRVPEITEPAPLLDTAERLSGCCGQLLVAGLEAEADLAAVVNRDHGELALIVGPEGGFEPDEWQAMGRLGARGFAWGARTLRAETAAVVLSALVLDRAERQRDPEPTT